MPKRSGASRPSRLAVPFAVLVLSGGLTACGGSGDDEADDEEEGGER